MTESIEDKKQAWRDFYAHEKKMFAYIASQDCLYSGNNFELEYSEYITQSCAVIEKPPRFIRRICQLTEDSEFYVSLSKKLHQLYRTAVADSLIKFPVRFPEFYENIEQINVSVNDAFESIAIKPNEIVTIKKKRVFDLTKTEEYDGEFRGDVQSLQELGINATYSIDDDLNAYGSVSKHALLTVNSDDLFAYANCTSIQRRKKTGNQYRARIRERGQSSGTRIKLGLIVIDKDSDVAIVQSNPQTKRRHALSKTNKTIELPIETDFTLYCK